MVVLISLTLLGERVAVAQAARIYLTLSRRSLFCLASFLAKAAMSP
jgi:hypothetical protein